MAGQIQVLEAQTAAWSLGPMIAWSDYRGGARDPNGLSLEPSSRLEAGLILHRDRSAWQLSLSATWAPGHLSTRDSTGDVAQLDLLGSSFARLRLAPLIGRRLIRIGTGGVELSVGPLLDVWHGDEEVRPRLGGQLQIGLIAPLGGLQVRNFVGWSATGSPFNRDEFGPSIQRPLLQAIALGLEIRGRF